MEVTLYDSGEGQIKASISLAAHCIVNPFIVAVPGRESSKTLLSNLQEMQKLCNRKNYLEVIFNMAPIGLGIGEAFVTWSFVPLDHNGEIYGITPDGSAISLLSRQESIDLFSVMDEPSYEVAEEFKDFYGSSKLNMRDAVHYYPLTMDAEVIESLRTSEKDLYLRSMINNWVNNRADMQPIDLGLTIPIMVDRLENTIGAERLFAACWTNVEGYTSAIDIPVIQRKLIPSIEREYVSYYVYMLNLMLNKTDDLKSIEQLYAVRYLLGHQ